MTRFKNKALYGGLLAALGLGAFSPLSIAGVSMLAAHSAPAVAAGKIKGKIKSSGDNGLVLRRLSDRSLIVAPTDQEGAVYLSGLEAGDYEVKLMGDATPSAITVGPDGQLVLVAQPDEAGAGGPEVEPADPRARKAKRAARKAVRASVEPVEFGKARPDSVFDTKAAMIDVNTADVASLMKDTNNSPEAAAFIVAERGRDGPYKDPLDFAKRVGGSVSVDFGYSSTRMGDTMIIAKGLNPKNPGFKTVAKSGVVELYGQKHNYVGHVTLLK